MAANGNGRENGNGKPYALVVEPARIFQHQLEDLLEPHGMDVRTAEEVGQALSIVSHDKPRVIFTSYELPGLAAPSLVAALKVSSGHKAIPLCIMTSDEGLNSLPGPYQPEGVIHKTRDFLSQIEEFLGKVGLESDGPSEDTEHLEGNILLAEDVRTNQVLMSRLLHVAGAEVTVAENGIEAVSAASAADFDLVLMDIEMPEMDGLTATKLLRKLGLNMPIIALSGHDDDAMRERAIAAGMDDLISKGSERGKMIAACRRMIC